MEGAVGHGSYDVADFHTLPSNTSISIMTGAALFMAASWVLVLLLPAIQISNRQALVSAKSIIIVSRRSGYVLILTVCGHQVFEMNVVLKFFRFI